jgi:hypothetical protein
VLEEVCETRSAFALVARANVVSDIESNHGRAVIFDRNYAQPVLEFGLAEIY